MKYVRVLLLLFVLGSSSEVCAADAGAGNTLPSGPDALSKECNLEARNSLIHEDLALVKKVCMEAIAEIEKADVDKEYLINPIMNLAFSYTLAGEYDKAAPLYARAKSIRKELYGADSRKLKEIEDMIENQEEMKRQQSKPRD